MSSVVYDVNETLYFSEGVPVGLDYFDIDDNIEFTPGLNNRYDNVETYPIMSRLDGALFGDIQINCISGYGGVFSNGHSIELYMISTLDFHNPPIGYEDGSYFIDPPASSFIGVYELSDKPDSQVHILRQIPLPPLAFKFLAINKSTTLDYISLTMRSYRYKTI